MVANLALNFNVHLFPLSDFLKFISGIFTGCWTFFIWNLNSNESWVFRDIFQWKSSAIRHDFVPLNTNNSIWKDPFYFHKNLNFETVKTKNSQTFLKTRALGSSSLGLESSMFKYSCTKLQKIGTRKVEVLDEVGGLLQDHGPLDRPTRSGQIDATFYAA